jgi:hypothetical protein
MLQIPQRDIDDGTLDGVVDIHCHAGPCIYIKDFDEIQTAQMMAAAGYRGVLFKQHLLGANRIELVRNAVPGLGIFGGICLNHYVGGINPFAVASCIAFGGREVKLPTVHAANHMRAFGTPTYSHIEPTAGAKMEARIAQMVKGITIFDENGKLIPEMYDILDFVADADIGIETGHISKEECMALVKAARERGVKRVWQTHANWRNLYEFTMEELIEMADNGAYIELTANFALQNMASDVSNKATEYTAAVIKAVGADRCVMATDYGLAGRANPVDGMRVFIRTMMRHGIPRSDTDKMAKRNPAFLVGLD